MFWLQAILTFTAYTFQIAVAIKLTSMVYKAAIKTRLAITTYFIVWLVCISAILILTTNNLAWIWSSDQFNQFLSRFATAFFQITAYSAILYIVWLLNKINDRTVELALQIEAVHLSKRLSSRINIDDSN
jgi:hypothetical protein